MGKSLGERNRLFALTFSLLLAALGAVWACFLPERESPAGDSVLRADGRADRYDVNLYLEALPDPTGAYTYEQVRSPSFGNAFRPAEGTAAFGLGAKTYWFRTTLEDRVGAERWVLRLTNAVIDRWDVYANGRLLGDKGETPLGYRLDDHYGAYELRLPAGESVTLHMRAQTDGSMIAPIELLTASAYHAKLRSEYVLFGVYYGFVLLMAAYILSMYVFFRYRAYLYYSLYLFFFAGSQLVWNGLPQELLGPDHPALRLLLRTFDTLEGVFLFFFIVCLWFGLFFLISVLELDRYAPRLRPAARIIQGVSPLVVLGLLFHWPWFYAIAIWYEMAVVAFLVVSTFWSVLNGNRTARYLMLGFLAIIGCAAPAVLYTFGILDDNLLTHYGYQLGSFAEFIILAFALSYQSRQLQKDKEAAREELIGQQRELVRTLERWNEELESTVRERTEKLVRTQKERTEMLQGISHDIRAPLTVVQGGIRAMMLGVGLGSDDRERTLQKLYDKVLYMNRFMDDLFELSRFEGEEEAAASLPPEPVRAREWALGEFRALEEDIRALRHDCVVRVDVDETLALRVDSHAMRRALVNLAHNACKFSPPGAMIALEASARDGWLTLAVTDRGIGIAPEHLPDVFTRTYRVDGSNPASGAGLGLAIAKQIVERHGGRIRAESRPGEGSRFELALPAVAP